MMNKKLSLKELHFVREYIVDKNGTRAAIAAGYKNGTGIAVQASRMLNKVNVKAAVELGLSLQLQDADLRAEDVVAELRKLGFSNFSDYASFGPDGLEMVDSRDLSREQLAAVSEVTETTTKDGGSTKFKLHDKHAPLVTLARHFDILGGAKPNDDEGDGLMVANVRPRVEARLVAIGERVTMERIVTERVIVERTERQARKA